MKSTPTPSRQHLLAWRRKPAGECQWVLTCTTQRGHYYYCPAHRAYFNAKQNKTRRYRMSLGFCIDCLKPMARGRIRCPKHLKATIQAQATRRGKKNKARGWKFVKIKC